ncbi:MAG TPA: hypothetical protein VGU20_01090 [Stellaceae bacterium]|nr:hypothetical protein [Stellaceae bacterium]
MDKNLGLAFRAPNALLLEAENEMSAVEQERLFNDARHQKSREKWCAGMFGLGYERYLHPCRVAINATKFRTDADFFLEARGARFPFQIVEVMEPGRRRGAEFKGFANGTVTSIPYEPERGHFDGPQWIARLIKQKVAKSYANATSIHLLVYANFPARALQHAAVVAASARYRDSFASAWVLTNLHLGALWAGDDLGRLEGWAELQTIEQYNERVGLRRPSSGQ